MKKIIGVLGGMGPESTADFYSKMIIQCQQKYGAQYDHDYPEIFIYNLPIPDVVEGLQNPHKTVNMLINGVKKLETIGVNVIALPCNTVHYFYPQMAQSINTPFICIFLATAKHIHAQGLNKIGFLATTTTIEYKSFADDFDRNDIELLIPNKFDQDIINSIILNILAGKKLNTDKQELLRIIDTFKTKGAQGIALACTDLPILITQDDCDIPIFDTTNILASATIDYAVGNIGNEILE